MLGWALKKSFQGATGARDAPVSAGDDTTQLDMPDTPAPIFAARAIKNAIFGESAPSEKTTKASSTASQKRKGKEPANPITNDATSSTSDMKSPSKPTSILLTPGTGTARRKRVSFGHDVKAGSNTETGLVATNPDGSRKKTTLQQALENSRSAKSKQAAKNNGEQSKEVPVAAAVATGKNDANDGADSESEWEDDVCNHDVTVDLNEPHSNSGKYWKSEFTRYHEEARAEMDRLVRYKHMAKSYAKKKDAEAINLTQRLKEEQDKALKMEQKITQMAAQMADKRKHGTDNDNATLMQDLAKQTTLAVQYRDQVNGLEAILNGQQDEAGPSRSARTRINTSPRTEKTIYETKAELRRLRSELRQMDSIREENKRLKSDLGEAKKLVDENKKQARSTTENSRVQRLEEQLREARDELRQKASEIRKLSRDYEILKRDAKARTAEAMQVLQQKNDKIAQLEKEIKALKADNASVSHRQHNSIDAVLADHNKISRDLRSDIESLNKPYKHENSATTTAARRRQPRQRSVSVEDITLGMTQRSLFGQTPNKEKRPLTTGFEGIKPTATTAAAPLPFTDWTNNSLKDIEDELRKEKADHVKEIAKRDRETFTDTFDLGPLAASVAAKKGPSSNHQPLSFSSRRAMSDRVNESTPPDNYTGSAVPSRERRSSTYYKDASGTHRTAATSTTASSARAAAADDKYAMHGALGGEAKPTTRQQDWIAATSGRAVMATDETDTGAQGVDLFQDRFARLGGGGGGGGGGIGASAPGTSANASRCTLPADRQAAARARLEKKKLEKLERLREKEERDGRVQDKENLVPC